MESFLEQHVRQLSVEEAAAEFLHGIPASSTLTRGYRRAPVT